MRRTEQIVREYEQHNGNRTGATDAVRSISYLLGFIFIFLATASLNYQAEIFGGGLDDLGIPIWHIRPLPFPAVEIVFSVCGLWILGATYTGKTVSAAHITSSFAWLVVGVLWVAYGIIYHPDYVFTLGILALFSAAQHLMVAQIWALERTV